MCTGVSPKRIATRKSLLSFPRAVPPSLSSFSLRSNDSRAVSPHIAVYLFRHSYEHAQRLSSQTPDCTRSLTTRQQNNLYIFFLRKEVIQPHLPIRLPCYDFTPVIRPAFDSSLIALGSPASGISDSHGVTGGVYKTRERIHRSILICDY